MGKKSFNPEKYGMAICPCCQGHGFIQNPERKCCPKCGAFGLIKNEAEKATNTPAFLVQGEMKPRYFF